MNQDIDVQCPSRQPHPKSGRNADHWIKPKPHSQLPGTSAAMLPLPFVLMFVGLVAVRLLVDGTSRSPVTTPAVNIIKVRWGLLLMVVVGHVFLLQRRLPAPAPRGRGCRGRSACGEDAFVQGWLMPASRCLAEEGCTRRDAQFCCTPNHTRTTKSRHATGAAPSCSRWCCCACWLYHPLPRASLSHIDAPLPSPLPLRWTPSIAQFPHPQQPKRLH